MAEQQSAVDHSQQHGSSSNSHDRVVTTTESVRSRWTPKPEQILILESIFNSGMVNPPKDETVRIRKLLEKFGAVGDANVFYWFQNRRSRSRRRQRQLQAGLAAGNPSYCASGAGGAGVAIPRQAVGVGGGANGYEQNIPSRSSTSSSSNSSSGSRCDGGGFISCAAATIGAASASTAAATSSSSSSGCLIGDDAADDLFWISRQMGFPEIGHAPSMLPSSLEPVDFSYPSGFITVLINGIPSEIPRGPFDTRAVFGNDAVLVHSSGEILPVNEYGILFQGLQMGESYFLVSRPS